MKKMGSEFFNNFIEERFRDLSAEELILDETFRKIVAGEIGNGNVMNILVNRLPEKREEIILAFEVLKGLQSDKVYQSDRRKKDLWDQLVKQAPRQKHFPAFLYFASAISILFILVFPVLTFKIKAGIEKVSLAPVLDNNEITLVLAHGEQFILDNKPYSVKHYNDGSIYYEGNNSKLRSTVSDNSFCQLIVPFGKRSTLLLSDGTKVWLNSGSRLVYPPVFKGKNREVLLEGEAFFDVSKDQARPFYVRTDAFRIKVYGTRFDVQASGKENEFTATLVEGKVSIIPNEKFMPEEVFLLPNQKAISSKNHNNIEVKKLTDLENSFSWINGYFSFDKEEISGVLKKISHYYNVPIELDLGDNDLKITGKLDLKDDVERVISALTIFTKTKYMKQDNKYLIYNE